MRPYRRSSGVLGGVLLTLGVMTPTGSARARPAACSARSAITASATARVFRLNGDVAGCLIGHPWVDVIAESGGENDRQIARIDGDWASVVTRIDGHCLFALTDFANLRTGERRRNVTLGTLTQPDDALGCDDSGIPEQIRVRPDGAIGAVITLGSRREIYAADRSIAIAADIDPGSLRWTPGTVTWTQAGAARAARVPRRDRPRSLVTIQRLTGADPAPLVTITSRDGHLLSRRRLAPGPNTLTAPHGDIVIRVDRPARLGHRPQRCVTRQQLTDEDRRPLALTLGRTRLFLTTAGRPTACVLR